MLRQRAASGAGHLFIGNTLSQVIQGAGLIIVARLLGATAYGLYALLLVPSATFFVFTQIGFGGATTRYVAYYNAMGKREEADRLTASTFLYAVMFYGFITILAALAAPAYMVYILHEPSVVRLAQLGALTIFFQGTMSLTTAALNGYYRTKHVSAVLLIQATVKTVLSISLILVGLHIYGALLGTILSFAAAAAAGTFWMLRTTRTMSPRFDVETLRKVFSFGLPIYAANIMNGVSRQIQMVILATFTSAAAVGAFTATQNLATLISVVTNPIATMSGVAFTEVYAKNESNRILSSYIKATKLATILIVPASFFAVFAARPVVTVLYGPAYSKFYLLLAIFALGYLSVGLGAQTQAPLFGSLNNTKLYTYSAALNATLLLALSFGLALKTGVLGVGAATALSTLLATAMIHSLIVGRLGVKLPKTRLAKIYMAGAISTLPFLVLPERIFHHGVVGLLELILVLIAYVLLYATALPLVQGVTKEELTLIAQSLEGIPLLGAVLLAITRYSALLLREKEPQGADSETNIGPH
jgi:O-antigen/teichoic acid export membrane protein